MASLGSWVRGNNIHKYGGTFNVAVKATLISQNPANSTSVVNFQIGWYSGNYSPPLHQNWSWNFSGSTGSDHNWGEWSVEQGYTVLKSVNLTISHSPGVAKTVYYSGSGSVSDSSETWGTSSISTSAVVPAPNVTATISSVSNFYLTAGQNIWFNNPANKNLRVYMFVEEADGSYLGHILERNVNAGDGLWFQLSDSEMKSVYNIYAGRGGANVRFRTATLAPNGVDWLGYSDKYVWSVAPPIVTITGANNYAVGGGQYSTFDNPASRLLKYTMLIRNKSGVEIVGTSISRDIGGVNNYTLTPTSGEIDLLYQNMTDRLSASGKIYISSYGTSGYTNLLGTNSKDITVSLDPNIIKPEFSNYSVEAITNSVQVKDAYGTVLATNDTLTLTGSNQKIIKGKNKIRVTITEANKMVVKKWATPVRYEAQNSDKGVFGNYKATGSVTIDLSDISSVDTNVSAHDSRGLVSPFVKKSFSEMIDYSPVSIFNMGYKRDNNVEGKTKLSFQGKMFSGKFGNTTGVTNTLTVQYRYKESNSENWSAWGSVTPTVVGEDFTFNDYVNGDLGISGFNPDKSYSVEVRAYDKLSCMIGVVTVSVGTPVLHWTKKGLAINSKYNDSKGGSLQVDGENIASGWSKVLDTWTFGSVDNPTGVINWTGANSKVSAGMRIKFDNGGHTIYGIVTAVSSSTMTFLHEMNEANNNAVNLMANSEISNPNISAYKVPLGFNANPSRWSVKYSEIVGASRDTPTANSWYNLGSVSLVVPIGLWNIGYKTSCYTVKGSASFAGSYFTLSTSSSSESDFGFRVANIMPTSDLITTAVCPPKLVNRTTKATYYLNQSTPYAGTTRIATSNYARTIIEAVCAYL